VTVRAHAPSEAERIRGGQALEHFRELAARADPEKVTRMKARVDEQLAVIELELSVQRARLARNGDG